MKKNVKKDLVKEINNLSDFFKNHNLPYAVVSINGKIYDDYYLKLKLGKQTISFVYLCDLVEPIGLYKSNCDLFCLIINSVHVLCDEVVITCE